MRWVGSPLDLLIGQALASLLLVQPVHLLEQPLRVRRQPLHNTAIPSPRTLHQGVRVSRQTQARPEEKRFLRRKGDKRARQSELCGVDNGGCGGEGEGGLLTFIETLLPETLIPAVFWKLPFFLGGPCNQPNPSQRHFNANQRRPTPFAAPGRSACRDGVGCMAGAAVVRVGCAPSARARRQRPTPQPSTAQTARSMKMAAAWFKMVAGMRI